jgi:hypothetical protein
MEEDSKSCRQFFKKKCMQIIIIHIDCLSYVPQVMLMNVFPLVYECFASTDNLIKWVLPDLTY